MNDFAHFGAEPGDDLRHFDVPRRAEPGEWPMLEAALAVVNRDLSATLPGRDALVLVVAPPGRPLPSGAIDTPQVYVAMSDGRWHGDQVNAVDPEDGDPPEPDDAGTALTLVADAAQSTVMELLSQVWPVCPEHRIGTHPRPAGTTADWLPGDTSTDGPPVWWCRGSLDGPGHDVCTVGELAATLPGKQRRALRRTERGRAGRR
ncbi:hypothetical protein [Streptomyces fructofermentans]|uniref:Uncharacterized protein n=1 Tax=Streptomyces fructofermentans TaxID=152141 RepID=A0A918U595_9ACTN|nr:hypothetical protein [Streptomyces fructofermentans]GGX92941.1 hypothetical protein GCM10010515_69830 [Streptomyces fructofermentans]